MRDHLYIYKKPIVYMKTIMLNDKTRFVVDVYYTSINISRQYLTNDNWIEYGSCLIEKKILPELVKIIK